MREGIESITPSRGSACWMARRRVGEFEWMEFLGNRETEKRTGVLVVLGVVIMGFKLLAK